MKHPKPGPRVRALEGSVPCLPAPASCAPKGKVSVAVLVNWVRRLRSYLALKVPEIELC